MQTSDGHQREERETTVSDGERESYSHSLNAATRLDHVLSELARKAANAAEPRKNKPTMWAYYRRMEHDLRAAFEGVPLDQVERRAVQLSAEAVELASGLLDEVDAAHAWAVGVYARRVAGVGGRSVSLDWLRQRAA